MSAAAKKCFAVVDPRDGRVMGVILLSKGTPSVPGLLCEEVPLDFALRISILVHLNGVDQPPEHVQEVISELRKAGGMAKQRAEQHEPVKKTWHYKAKDPDDRKVHGEVKASDSAEAIAEVRKKDFRPTSLREEGGPERLMCIDGVSLCEPNEKPPHHCDGCGG